MGNGLNILFEILFMGLQFAAFWLLFYKLYYQESKIKRILLVIFMALFCPLDSFINRSIFRLPLIIRITLPLVKYVFFVILAGGKKRNIGIMAAYYWSITFLVDIIISSLFLGFTGNFIASNNNLYLKAGIAYYFGMFLWAVFYYSVMWKVPQEAINRISLRIWFCVLFIPSIGAAAIYFVYNPLKKQLDAGFNNFHFLGFFGLIMLMLNLFIFYLYIKLVSSYNARLLAGELNKTPPVYTAQNGLSAEFIEKYDLSKRQTEIAEALLQGRSNKEISVMLDIKVNTVQVHLQNVYQKTGAPGRYALMALVGIGK
jgi:DNA-binding CsgD family transcriptional regulator